MPRIGPRRELKSALESYWSGKSNAAALLEAAAGLRAANWARQHALGITNIPSNDFSLYDHVLDTSVMVGAIPDIYGALAHFACTPDASPNFGGFGTRSIRFRSWIIHLCSEPASAA
jgi:hypothetical protein